MGKKILKYLTGEAIEISSSMIFPCLTELIGRSSDSAIFVFASVCDKYSNGNFFMYILIESHLWILINWTKFCVNSLTYLSRFNGTREYQIERIYTLH